MERIQKILSAMGVCSRRKAEEWIAQGRVTCNGAVCHIGDCAEAGTDILAVDGVPVCGNPEKIYIMLHKPRGYVTTLSDEKGRPDVTELVRECGQRVYPVGRLDMDSEGLLLMTNDGDFANRMMHPSHEVDKTYRVLLKPYDEIKIAKLSQPMELDGYALHGAGVRLTSHNGEKAVAEITIHEGRNRQVRRMCAKCGLTVLRLKRIREGTLELGALQPGAWRYLTEEELKSL